MELVYEDENEDYAEKPLLTVVDRKSLAAVMGEQDVVLSF
jgi:tRNA 2-thiouridine synthesizing protein C